MDAPLVSIFLAGKPQGKGRPRIMMRGKRLVPSRPDATVNYEAALTLAGQQAMGNRPLLAGGLDVLMVATFPIAPSWPKKRQTAALEGLERPLSKPDCDNVAKVVDALNGVVWGDDAQIVDHTVRKRYGAAPGLLIEIRPAEPF